MWKTWIFLAACHASQERLHRHIMCDAETDANLPFPFFIL